MTSARASANSQLRTEEACQVTSSQALQTAVKHSFISSDAKTVCRLLQTCKSWRVALQQCAAANLDIGICCGTSGACAPLRIQGIQKTTLFCGWLQQHGGLVSSISFAGQHGDVAVEDAAEQLLVLGLQAACRHGAATRPAAAAAVAALQLRTFSIDTIRSPALLRALPAAALTHLSLALGYSSGQPSSLSLNSSSITAALAQLSSLRSLSMFGTAGCECLAAVGQLPQLTYLAIEVVSCCQGGSSGLHLLPQQLQECDLTVLVSSGGSAASNGGRPARMQFGHITALRTLNLSVNCSAAEGSSLPPSLTNVQVWLEEGSAAVSMQHFNIPALPQLQQLRAGYCLQEPQLLASLSTMTTLTSLDMSYAAAAAVHAAALWQHLPALHNLRLETRLRNSTHEVEAPLDPSQSLLLLQGLAAATSLTALDIDGHRGSVVHEHVQLCAYVTGLTRLQYLAIHWEQLVRRADVMQLTALTNLTGLDVSGAEGVDDTAASALALALKRLQGLRLEDCSLTSAAALPSIATLTALTSLSLAVGSHSGAVQLALGREDLLLLAPLRKLKELECSGFFSPDAVQELWDEDLEQWRQPQA